MRIFLKNKKNPPIKGSSIAMSPEKTVPIVYPVPGSIYPIMKGDNKSRSKNCLGFNEYTPGPQGFVILPALFPIRYLFY